MTIKELKELLVHFEGREWENVKIRLWDYNNQREAIWNGGSHSFSKTDMELTFPIEVPPVDGKTINDRLQDLYNRINAERNGSKKVEGN